MSSAFRSAFSSLRLHEGLATEERKAVAEIVPRFCKNRRRLLCMGNICIKVGKVSYQGPLSLTLTSSKKGDCGGFEDADEQKAIVARNCHAIELQLLAT